MTGEVSVIEALCLLFGLLGLALWLVIKLTAHRQLSFIGAALTIVYPFMKLHPPQVVLGMAFSWSIPMAFAARTVVAVPRKPFMGRGL